MRWITFFILLYLMAALQVSHLLGIPHVHSPEWPAIEYLPILAIFYALYATDSYAPHAGLLCGLLYDLTNADMIGTNAVPLALVAFLIVRVRLSIFREHFMAQLLITLFAILLFALFSLPMRYLAHAPFAGLSLWSHLAAISGNAVYSSVIAPLLFLLFFRFPSLLGFTSQGPRTRGNW